MKENNGKYIIELSNEDSYQFDANSGIVKKYIDVINYNGKTRDTLVEGDDISIGTEKFKVFSVKEGKIKAMPYYNLKLDLSPIKQATSQTSGSAGKVTFAKKVYWNANEDNINMDNSDNNIQKYILAYKKTLEDLGAEGIKVRNVKYSEISAEGVTDLMRNPGQDGRIWISSCNNNSSYIWGVYGSGELGVKKYNDDRYGVRPILVID